MNQEVDLEDQKDELAIKWINEKAAIEAVSE
jgi:hypothetical protein